MKEKAVAIKEKAKELWVKHGGTIYVGGMIICGMIIGREIGYAQGYVNCLSNMIKASCGAAEK